MQIKFDFSSGCLVKREVEEKCCSTETEFYHRLKKELQKQGHNVIKKLAYKDGHLLDQYQYYIREQKWKFCVYDSQYALRLIHKPFNNWEEITMSVQSGKDWV